MRWTGARLVDQGGRVAGRGVCGDDAAGATTMTAQQQPAPPGKPERAAATADDHQNMMEQLGIKALRPGPSGNEAAPNHANYDEATANPFPESARRPDAEERQEGHDRRRCGGTQRRPEIVEDFEREVLGRVPKNVPKVTWTVTRDRRRRRSAARAVDRQAARRARRQLGVPGDQRRHPDDAGDAGRREGAGAGDDDVRRRHACAAAASPPPPGRGGFASPPPPPGSDPPATEQLIADGWGYASINPGSIQADNGAGLTKGIIGLVNKGQPRKPDDWGALRAWAWGASRGARLSRDRQAVDAKRVGIEGVSRYGKAALVTMAFDTRFAVVLVGSSGEGGAKLHRRNWGEAVENLTGSGEYHWMAGNFLKYGAAEATFGSKNAGDIPVDAHELIALCAPRLTFISYGVPEKGDAKWLDHQGSYMAAVAAQPVFRLLGAKDLGTSDDYTTEKMPAGERQPARRPARLAPARRRPHRRPELEVLHPVGRQVLQAIHRRGRRVRRRSPPAARGRAGRPARRRAPTTNSMTRARAAAREGDEGGIDVYFEGDSITRRWGATDYPEFLANWKPNFFGWNAADFGWGADRIAEHPVAARERRAGRREPEGHRAAGRHEQRRHSGRATTRRSPTSRAASRRSSTLCRQKAPNATIILTGIFPRNDNMAVDAGRSIGSTRTSRSCADGKKVRYLERQRQAGRQGRQAVRRHDERRTSCTRRVKGYQVWADALKPIFTELLGPPAATDHAPPPTGDPSARREVNDRPRSLWPPDARKSKATMSR